MPANKISSEKPTSNSPQAITGEESEKFVDVTEFQNLGSRQLDALVSQHKLDIPSDASDSEKVHALIDYHAARGEKLKGSGTLQVLPDGFGFLRSRWFNYLGGPDDIYVSPSQIRKFGLGNGDTVEGQIRLPKENERFFALLRVFKVNQLDPEDAKATPHFDDLRSVSSNRPIVLESQQSDLCRIVDLIAPLGFGQRGLIVGPARSGKTRILTELCESTLEASREIYAFMLLVDQRPEEINELEDRLNGPRCEVISSVFDENTQRHNDVSMMVLEKAKRKVEAGEHVILFLDSLSKLAGFELQREVRPNQNSGETLIETRSFLASAKQTESEGTLTIISTLTVDESNEQDAFVAETLRATANMEIALDEKLVRRRIWPAIDLHRSQTRLEEELLGDRYKKVCQLRGVIGGLDSVAAMQNLLERIAQSDTNEALLDGLG